MTTSPPETQNSLARDALLAAALAVAIGLVFLLEGRPRSSPVAIESPTVIEPPTAIEPEPAAQSSKLMRIAVIPETAEFDDMGRLLDTLGTAYTYRRTGFDDLLEPEALRRFDIVFVTCSGYPANWLGEASGGQLRGNELRQPNEETFARAKAALRGFVNGGGTLYASDLHFNLIAECFPEFVDRSRLARGVAQTVEAAVVEPGLRELLGETIDLTFDQDGWAAAALAGEGMTTYLEGTFKVIDGTEKKSPLLVKMSHGKGTIVFTSFHNEKQNSKSEHQLLKYLVFSAVTAGVDSEATRQMARGGFSATRRNLFSASKDAESVSQVFDNRSVSHLQFVLAFPEQGATLELAVTGPDGATVRKRGSTTLTIDVPAAAAGSWEYSITAVRVPSENFPFTITVGRKD